MATEAEKKLKAFVMDRIKKSKDPQWIKKKNYEDWKRRQRREKRKEYGLE